MQKNERMILEGESYFSVLNKIHSQLKPKRYLEIGVANGESLTIVREGCYAVAVDPHPKITHEFLAWTQLYTMTSEEFYATYKGEPFDLIFIDGLHQYETIVKDFCGAEKLSHPNTVLLIHDTIPITEETSQSEFRAGFWTGDVWKLVPALLEARKDLKVFTIASPPSGLTVVKGFSTPQGIPAAIVEKYAKKTFSWVEADRKEFLKIIPNDSSVWMQKLLS